MDTNRDGPMAPDERAAHRVIGRGRNRRCPIEPGEVLDRFAASVAALAPGPAGDDGADRANEAGAGGEVR